MDDVDPVHVGRGGTKPVHSPGPTPCSRENTEKASRAWASFWNSTTRRLTWWSGQVPAFSQSPTTVSSRDITVAQSGVLRGLKACHRSRAGSRSTWKVG